MRHPVSKCTHHEEILCASQNIWILNLYIFFIPGLSEIDKRKNQQRFIKTHLPFHLLPDQISEKNAKIIYIHRDPKDMMVSYYFFARMLTFINYIGTLKEFAWQVMLNKVPYGPYFDHLNNYLTAAQNQPKKVRGNP